MAEAPGNGGFVGGTYPSGAYGYDISNFQCTGSFPTGDHQIGIVQVDGASDTTPRGPIPQHVLRGEEMAWAGGGLNLYTYLTYSTSTTNQPGCNGDTSCNAGYQAACTPTATLQADGAGSTTIPWWLDVETADANWSGNPSENAQFVQGALNALHETEAFPTSASTPARVCGTPSSATTSRACPIGWPTTWPSPSGPGSCDDYSNWVNNHGARLPGPPEIVQYNSQQYDEDYAC